MSTYSWGTEDEPCSTMGNPGSSFITASSTSKANGGVTGALSGRKLVSADACTDGDSQRIAARTCSEVYHFGGVGVGVVVGRNFVFDAGQYAEFAFDGYVILVSVIGHFLGEGNVLLVGQMRTVDHHRRESAFDTALAQFEAVTVVQVEDNLRMLPAQFLGISNSALCHIAQQRSVGVSACALGYLKNDRSVLLLASLGDTLNDLHVVHVESADSVAAVISLLEHLSSSN